MLTMSILLDLGSSAPGVGVSTGLPWSVEVRPDLSFLFYLTLSHGSLSLSSKAISGSQDDAHRGKTSKSGHTDHPRQVVKAGAQSVQHTGSRGGLGASGRMALFNLPLPRMQSGVDTHGPATSGFPCPLVPREWVFT